MKACSWTVFFLFKPLTSINTTILTAHDDVDEERIVHLAKEKIKDELNISIDALAASLGINDNFGEGWIIVEMNDTSPTDKELEVLKIHP